MSARPSFRPLKRKLQANRRQMFEPKRVYPNTHRHTRLWRNERQHVLWARTLGGIFVGKLKQE